MILLERESPAAPASSTREGLTRRPRAHPRAARTHAFTPAATGRQAFTRPLARPLARSRATLARPPSLMVALTLALALALAVATGCKESGGTRAGKEPAAPGAPAGAAPSAAETLPARDIVLFFPSPDDDLLHAQMRSVVPIDAPEDRAKQCLEELFRGPGPGLLPAVPEGVRVREIYILADGTTWVDLTADIVKEGAGSKSELLTVYAIVDTVARNVKEVTRLGILVEGHPRETLLGHVFTRDPIVPDLSYLKGAASPGSAPADGEAPPAASSAEEEKAGGEGDGTVAGGSEAEHQGTDEGERKGAGDHP